MAVKEKNVTIKFSFFPQVDVVAKPNKRLTRKELRNLRKLVIEIEDKVEEQMHEDVMKTWYKILRNVKVKGLKFNLKSGKAIIPRGKK